MTPPELDSGHDHRPLSLAAIVGWSTAFVTIAAAILLLPFMGLIGLVAELLERKDGPA